MNLSLEHGFQLTRFERVLQTLGMYGVLRRRLTDRWTFQGLRSYLDAAKADRLTGDWRRNDANARTIWRADAATIRGRARYLVESDSYAKNARQVIVDNVVGTGVGSRSKIVWAADRATNRTRNRQLDDAKWLWQERFADAKGVGRNRRHWRELQALWLQTVITDGEALLVESAINEPGRPIPLAYELVECDRLTGIGTKPAPGNEVVDGLEIDPQGRVVAYHIVQDDPTITGTMYTTAVRYPAARVRHGYRWDRAGQLRGLSWFTPVIPDMYMLKDIKEYALIARKVQAAIALVVTKNPAGGGVGPAAGIRTNQAGQDGTIQIRKAIEPGMIHELPFEADVHSHSPAPSADLDPLTKLILRSIGVGFGLSYEFLTADHSQVNFAGGRMSGINARRRFRGIHGFLVDALEAPVHEAWMDQAIAFGVIPRPPASADPYAVQFTNPSWELGVNPVQEVTAAAARVQNAMSSWRKEVEDAGGDWDETLEELADGKQQMEELGIAVDAGLGIATGAMAASVAGSASNPSTQV